MVGEAGRGWERLGRWTSGKSLYSVMSAGDGHLTPQFRQGHASSLTAGSSQAGSQASVSTLYPSPQVPPLHQGHIQYNFNELQNVINE